MPTRTFPPTPDDHFDENDEVVHPTGDDDLGDIEIIVSERGTEWEDEDGVESAPGLLELPSDQRVARFFEQVDRKSGRGGDVGLLSDLDRDGLTAFRRTFSQLRGPARSELARRLVSSSIERFDFVFGRLFSELLKDDDASVRQFGVVGFAHEDEPETLERLVSILEADSSPDVRGAAATALAPFAEEAAAGGNVGMDADELRDVLETVVVNEDEPRLLRLRALESYAVFGSRGAEGFTGTVAESIAEAFNEGDTVSQSAALLAMGRTLDRRWLQFIERELESEDAELRLAAVISAGEIGETTLVERLALLASDEDDEVRTASVIALGQIGGHGALRVLRNLAADPERDDPDLVNEAIEEATLAADEA